MINSALSNVLGTVSKFQFSFFFNQTIFMRFFDAHAYLSSDGSVLLQDDPPGVEFTRRGGLSPVVRVELPVVGQNPGQVDQSLHPFVCQNYKNPKPCH